MAAFFKKVGEDLKKAFYALLFVLIAVVLVQSSALDVKASDYSMETRAFDVDIEVREEYIYDVTTTIKVFFNVPKHGIYYYIPYEGEITRLIDGEKDLSFYKNRISRVRVPGYKKEVTHEYGNVVIRIGDADKTLTGEHTYVIKYRCKVGDDGTHKLDDVYWNIFPLDWESPIESGKFTVTMPKSFDPTKFVFVGGAYGGTDTELMDYSVDGLTVKAELKQPLPKGETVTFRLELPEGYFIKDNRIYPVIAFLILGTTGVIFLLWIMFGRSEKIIPVVSFKPPNGMTSAETGYIIDGTVDNKDLVSLLLFWASQGCISINQIENNNFEIIKRQNLPDSSKPYERKMFHDLFNGRDKTTTDKLTNSFYTTLGTTRNMLINHFESPPENNLYNKKSLMSRKISNLLMLVPAALFLILGIYNEMADEGWYIMTAFILVFLYFFSKQLIESFDKRKAMSRVRYIMTVLISIILIAAVGFAVFAVGTYVIGQPVLAAITVALTFFSIYLTMRMKKRTPQSRLWMQEILGLRNFIQTAELDRIKMLVEETPEYFYNVLPFAYVFGLTDKWAKNFEGIAMSPPDWYSSPYAAGMGMGYFNTMMFTDSLERSMRSVQTSMQSRPAPEGGGGGFSGGSSGGGGFSGGGFSGGGMGGGGGGSW